MDALAAAVATTTTTVANRDTAQLETVDAETRAVMQSIINPSSRAQSESENTKVILWLFDHEYYIQRDLAARPPQRACSAARA